MGKIYLDIKGMYIGLVDVVTDLLDSIARYPALWVLGIVALITTARLVYTVGYAMGRVSGL